MRENGRTDEKKRGDRKTGAALFGLVLRMKNYLPSPSQAAFSVLSAGLSPSQMRMTAL